MVSRCRSTIGKRPATTTCDTFRSIPTDENGASAKVEQSTPNRTSCGRCTSGVTGSSRMRSRCDCPKTEPPPCQCGRFEVGFVDLDAFWSAFGRVRCVPVRSFLVRNWCGRWSEIFVPDVLFRNASRRLFVTSAPNKSRATSLAAPRGRRTSLRDEAGSDGSKLGT